MGLILVRLIKPLSFIERESNVGLFKNKVIEGIPDTLKILKNSGKILTVETSEPKELLFL